MKYNKYSQKLRRPTRFVALYIVPLYLQFSFLMLPSKVAFLACLSDTTFGKALRIVGDGFMMVQGYFGLHNLAFISIVESSEGLDGAPAFGIAIIFNGYPCRSDVHFSSSFLRSS